MKDKGGKDYFKKLYELMKSKVSDKGLADFFTEEEYNAMVKSARGHAGGKASAKKRAEMAASEMSYSDISREIEQAFCAAYNDPDGMSNMPAYYVEAVYPSGYLIACEHATQKTFKVPYMLSAGEYVFGEFEEVEREVEYKPVSRDMMMSEGWRFFAEFQLGELPTWVQLFPRPGSYSHPEYGDLEISDGFLDRILSNFKSAVYQKLLPIDTGHNHQKLEDEGAQGWIEDARRGKDGSLEVKTTWTDLGKANLENERYRYISADWLTSYTDPEGREYRDVLRGAALTTRPFFKDKFLKPVLATEGALLAVTDRPVAGYRRVIRDKQDRYYFSALEPKEPNKPQEVNVMADKEPAQTVKGMSEDEARRLGELETSVKVLTETIEAKDKALTEAATENKALGDKVTKLEADARKQRLESLASDFTGDRAKHVQLMEKLATAFGEDSAELKQYAENERAHAEQLRMSGLFTETGHDAAGTTASALDKINAEARKLIEDGARLTFEQAFTQVITQQPKLYAEYQSEQGRAN